MPKVPRHLHRVNCFQEGVLEFDGPIGSVSADFRQFQVGGEGKKEARYGTDKKSESNGHI